MSVDICHICCREDRTTLEGWPIVATRKTRWGTPMCEADYARAQAMVKA